MIPDDLILINPFESPGFAALICFANEDCKAGGIFRVDTERRLLTRLKKSGFGAVERINCDKIKIVMKTRFFRLNLPLGLFLFAASAALLAAGRPFMKAWFYSFAWWSVILALDGLNYWRRGVSLLSGRVADFLFTAFLSIPVWLIFELFNLRLKNWSYHDSTLGLPVRWAGYAIAFATVIPALKELAALFQGASGGARKKSFFRLPISRGFLRLSEGTGACFLLLALVRPRLFFPLVWLGFIFLMEPLNYRRGRPSFLRDLETGEVGRIRSWMLAGATAGILWELFNFWAGAHWEYHLPYFDFGRIFQMPVLGYGGFIPFALEIFALDVFLGSVYRSIKAKAVLRTAFLAALIVFDLVCFHLIDRLSVLR